MRPSSFVRATQRVSRPATLAQEDEIHDDMNHAGVGAGGSGGPSRNATADAAPLSRSATQKSTNPRVQTNGINGHVSPSRDPQRRHSSALAKPTSAGDPIDPTVSNTQLVIGDRAWDVDPNKDPQAQQPKAGGQARTSPPVEEQDPLVIQMKRLGTTADASGPARRNTIRRDGPPPTKSPNAAPRDFRNSAEVVVGSYPIAQTPSRSASPKPPTAVFSVPPPPSVPPSSSNIPVEQVVSGYSRPFPGEPRSRANSNVGLPPPTVNQVPDQGASRPTSRAGYPGVGTQSLVARPTTPARNASPVAVQPYNNRGPPAPGAPPSHGNLIRGPTVSYRPVTPTNPVGIALGPDGRVIQDRMAQPVRQPGSHYPQPGPPPQPTQPPQPYPGYHDDSRALTQQLPQQLQQPPPQAPRNDYAVVAPNAYGGGTQPYNYGHPPQHPTYNDGYHLSYSQPQPPPPPPQPNHGVVTRPGYLQQQNQSALHVAGYQLSTGYRSTSPRRSPSPALRGQPPPPTGAYTDDGRPILFYGACFDACLGVLCADLVPVL